MDFDRKSRIALFLVSWLGGMAAYLTLYHFSWLLVTSFVDVPGSFGWLNAVYVSGIFMSSIFLLFLPSVVSRKVSSKASLVVVLVFYGLLFYYILGTYPLRGWVLIASGSVSFGLGTFFLLRYGLWKHSEEEKG